MHSDDTPTWVSPDAATSRQRRLAVPRPERAAAAPALPSVGSSFLGFRLLALLGRGAFGQVYLAEQADLANRYVALKVARDIFGESQTLAQLQHTNIVPIYSLHRVEPFQAVCMPYFGATTLADVLGQTQGQPTRPTSGKVLVDTVKDRQRTVVVAAAVEPAAVPADAEPRPVKPPSALQQLEHMSYVEAVLWLGERLADGLAHAHERGILHHDLKPANILLTEDGQPMLLDFSISEDTKRRERTAIAGGTLPYMSPEQLEAVREPARSVDGRSDVYGLGVIFHELLAGRLPYRTGTRFTPDAVATMLTERNQPPPALDGANPAVSPAVASIVAHCLEPDVARRYQSARELQEDLRRQRQNLPLRHARERSVRERATKWLRRHPRLTSTTSVALMLGAVVALLTVALVWRGEQAARLEALETLRRFRADAATVQVLLYGRHAEPAQLDAGLRQGRGALEHFAVEGAADWLQAPALRRLPAVEQQALRDEVGEILFLLARATALRAGGEPGVREARRLNGQAEAAFGKDRVPRALWQQRADLARLLGDAVEADDAAERARQVPVRTARDRYLVAHQHAINGQLRPALDLLQTVTQEDARSFPAWFVRGNCQYDLLQDGPAVASFTACVTLRPDFAWAWFNRGLAQLRLKQFGAALADFEQTLRLKPDLAEAHVGRGLALEGLGAPAEASAAYTEALAARAPSTRVYFLRSAARSKAGDAAGARRDYQQGLAAVPTDELSWIVRGSARRERDPAGALADYDEALRLNPRSFDGLQNKAALLSDRFHNDAAALAVLEQAAQHYPESALTRGGRGVLLARAGQRAAAIADARACLRLDASPAMQYQAACIYALTARQHADDRRQALPLLSAALRGGFGLEFVERDPDLEALRALPEFRRLVTAARGLAGERGLSSP